LEAGTEKGSHQKKLSLRGAPVLGRRGNTPTAMPSKFYLSQIIIVLFFFCYQKTNQKSTRGIADIVLAKAGIGGLPFGMSRYS